MADSNFWLSLKAYTENSKTLTDSEKIAAWAQVHAAHKQEMWELLTPWRDAMPQDTFPSPPSLS